MKVRNFVFFILLIFASLGFAKQSRPNVLFIAIDDLRPELGCYGAAHIKTPNLDALASGGMVFERAYCQVAVCGASRASLMTGVLPTSKRFVNYLTRADEDAPKAKTLPQVFKEAGYTTLSNGKIFHHQDDTDDRSWSEPAWRPEIASMASFDPATTRTLSKRKRGLIYEHPDVRDNAYADGRIAEKTIRDMQRLNKDGKPFFLACGFARPHLPFYAPKKYWDMYDRKRIEIADNRFRPANAPEELHGSGEYNSYYLGDFKVNSPAWHRMMRHGYYASVSYVDKLVGDVLAELECLELAGNTIVVVWGDHGWHLGEHNFWGKHNTMHLATRVPLIIKVPQKEPATTEALVETSDIFPTLCGLAGISVPKTVQGRSFEELLDDPARPFRDVVYTRFKQGDAVVTDRYTYTSYDGDKSHMLYDLRKDPSENRNVADNPENAKIVADMKARLAERIRQAKNANVAGPPSTGKRSGI